MDWGLLLRRLTAGAAEGQGQCLYAAVHNIQTGACIAYEPPEICPPQMVQYPDFLFLEAFNTMHRGKTLDVLVRIAWGPIAYPPQGVSESEVCELASSHRDPLRMYSGGVSICRLRFTFLKMEGKNVVLLRRPDAKCAVGFANTGTCPLSLALRLDRDRTYTRR
ncbi:hypothetical protein HPB49_019620 [Dermacentor silvarum]|uniref:Uncharacterized protein n=1 Tax=Dermacentor silvarum TaxID=543639 RepID=A0ACB8DFA0_DERSI|nr:hypothetical protein HPB49_019620 [Dermacentor silvarum]